VETPCGRPPLTAAVTGRLKTESTIKGDSPG
jgi:hypothetical protein